MKTRDVDVILKELKSKGYLFSADILKPEDLIESMVNLLRGNENVIDYIIDDYYIKAIYLITDSYKILAANRTTTTTTGAIFDKTTQYFDPMAINLLGFREEETLIRQEKGQGIFGGAMDRVHVYFNDGEITFLAKKGKGNEVYHNMVLQKLKKYIAKAEKESQKAAEAAPKKPAAKKTTAKSEATADGGEAIREIRKMYDDGIITKEELMELLKLQLKK